jgi:hypothetical protein
MSLLFFCQKNTWRYFSHADYAENAESMRNILTSRIELRRLCANFACANHPDGKAQAKRVRLCVFLYISPILILQNLCVNLRSLREKNLCVLCVFAWAKIITLIKNFCPFCSSVKRLISWPHKTISMFVRLKYPNKTYKHTYCFP